MSKEFKVGDRVRIYDASRVDIGVIDIQEDRLNFGVVCVRSLTGASGWFHPKQLRRLKKKEPRLEIWINLYGHGLNDAFHTTQEMADRLATPGRIRCVHFREVREKKK